MNETHDTVRGPCLEARRTIQEQLDGPIDAAMAAELGRHLGECAQCREYQTDLQGLQRSLRELPELGFPDDALDQVWDRTIRADRQEVVAPARVSPRVLLAAAAVLSITALLVVWNTMNAPTSPPEATAAYSQEEIEQAGREARQVLELTAQALNRSRNTAGRVLVDEISPALQRVPIRWRAVGEVPQPRRDKS